MLEMNETGGRISDHEPRPSSSEVVFCKWLNRRVNIIDARPHYSTESSDCQACNECQRQSA
jgi:hypothetical protein